MRFMPRPLLPIAVLAFSAPLVSADPGALDRFDCHNDADTGEYHCHGDEALADLGGLAMGLGGRATAWIYQGEDSYNLFMGPSLDVEFGLGAFAVQGSYHYKTLVNSDDEIYLAGWDVGAKVGRSVARYGTKYYAAAGFFSESLRRPNEENYSISGFYAGGGGGYNWDEYGFDVQVDWHSNSGYEEFFVDNPEEGAEPDMLVFAIRSSLTYRF